MQTTPSAPARRGAAGLQHLLDLIPPDAAVVLELGCGDGTLAARYKPRNPSGRYAGVALRPGATASLHVDHLITANPLSVSLPDAGYGPGTVDCLILHGRVLLASPRPAQYLQQLLKSLSKTGVLLFMAANKNAIPAASRQKTAPAQRSAACTPRELQAICKRAGCTAVEIIGAGGKPQPAAAGRRPVPAFIIARIPAEPPRQRMLLQTMTLPPIAACNDIRIHEPITCLKTMPGVRAVTMDMRRTALVKPVAGEAPVFIWQRPIMTRPDSVRRLRHLLAAGYLVIVEFDDDPRRWQKIVEHDYLTFRGVHAVQTSTEPLAEFLRQYNPNVKVFPNQILQLPEKKTGRDDGVVRLFFGALNREGDWQPFISALNRVLEDYGKGVHVTVIHDRPFFQALETPCKTFYPLCDYPAFLGHLRTCDISLLPLADTEFNRYKSDLKFIECAAIGTVVLASPVVYNTSVQEGVTGLLFNNVDEFQEKLRRLINDAGLRVQLADRAYAWVAQYRMLGRHYRDRHHWYQQLLDNRQELNCELRHRLPELFNV